MVRKKKGRATKKNYKVDDSETPDVVNAPHSFVIHRGLPCPYIQDLTKDFRRIMEPFTAVNLKEKKSNRIKDFISLSGVFHVSHICVFNKATSRLSFKIARLPRGPSLTFKVHQFTLSRDIITASRKQYIDEESFHHPPLVIMNNFTGDGKSLKLMATTFQNMFPTINLPTVKLNTIKRCVLFSYNPLTKLIEMRHYTILVVPMGLSRGVKKVVLGKIPNLSRCDDVADFFTNGGGGLSESEFEDDEANQVILPQNIKQRGNMENNKSAIRLHEIGPRLTFELVKVEEGLFTGEVLYHEEITRTETEIEEMRKRIEKKRKLKELRKKQQKENKLENDKKKSGNQQEKTLDDDVDNMAEPDNDAEYFKEEVGAEPDEELFAKRENSSKRVRIPKHLFSQEVKRRKINENKSVAKSPRTDKTKKKFSADGKDFEKKKFNKNKKAGKSGEKSSFGRSFKPGAGKKYAAKKKGSKKRRN